MFLIQNMNEKIVIQQVWAHDNVLNNDEADKLAKQKANWNSMPLDLTPFHLIGPPIGPTSTQHNAYILNINNI
jgi:hypothetical protein